MEMFELNLNQLIDVKLLRLAKPKFNNILLPLNGAYNSLSDLQTLDNENLLTSSKQPFENKLREFNLNDTSSVSTDNMFQISSSFGKVLYCETLEALLVFNNQSDREIKIKNIQIKVSNEQLENYESMFRKTEYFLANSNNIITIPGNQFYNHKIKINAEVMCKYSIEINLQYVSSYYNEEYIKQSSNKIVKAITENYFVESGSTQVIKKYYKKFIFATQLPFKIKDKFINDNVEKCYIEINLINQSPYNLHINEFILSPDKDKGDKGDNFISCLQEGEWRNFNIDQDEEVNLVYCLNNYNSLITHVKIKNI
jgi:hypothetical protein